jgi:hypothetical protein
VRVLNLFICLKMRRRKNKKHTYHFKPVTLYLGIEV